MSKLTEEYKEQIRKEFSNLSSNGEKWNYLYKLISENLYTYRDIQIIFNSDSEQVVEIFRKLDIKTCSNSNCVNNRVQSRSNFSKCSREIDKLDIYCNDCKKIKNKKEIEKYKQRNQNEENKIDYKKCKNSNCESSGVLLSISKFHKNSYSPDGYSNYCKKCQYENNQNLRKKNYQKNKSSNFVEYKICSNRNCPHGNEYQHISNFYRYLGSTDGLSYECKDCVKRVNSYLRSNYAYYDKRSAKLGKYHKIKRDPNNSELLQVRCSLCENWFNPTNLQIDNRIGAIEGRNLGENNFYCSDECKNSCPVFYQKTYRKDDPNRINLDREVQPELRELVFERDNWTCQRCNSRSNNLNCHHIEGIHWEPIESADVDKCITVCEDCHKEIHNIPGCTYQDMQCN